MAIAIEGFSVIARKASLEGVGGTDEFRNRVPNNTLIEDDDLARCAFMTEPDAREFLQSLFLLGLDTATPEEADVLMICEHTGEMTPPCRWLQVAKFKRRLVGWLDGVEPKSVVAPEGWDPEVDSPLQWTPTAEAAERLRFLRRDENVEVFLDQRTGQEVFIGRTGLPLDSMYEEARDFVFEHLRQPGAPPLGAEQEAEMRRAVEMLQIICERRPESWSGYWLLGKAWHALGDSELAYRSLSKAFDLEKDDSAVTRELAGICLELGKSQEAVAAAEAAVSQSPDDAELQSNLALAYLIDGRLVEADKAAEAAVANNPEDPINRAVANLVQEVQAKRRPQPQRLADLM